MIADVAPRLISMGYEANTEFVASDDGQGGVKVTWLSQRPMPSEAAINAFDMSAGAVAAREDGKEPLLADLKAQADTAIASNAAFLAIASPTNAQVLAQEKALTQQNTRLIKSLVRLVVRTWR